MNKTKKAMSLFSIILVFLIAASMLSSADPTYTVELDPEEPVALDKVKFTATIAGEDIQEVKISVTECDDSNCYVIGAFEEVMNEISAGVYEKEITLIQETGTYLKYYLIIYDNGTLYDLTDDFVRVDFTTSGNGDPEPTDDDTSEESPGFELIVMLGAIGLALILYKRKRVI